ncbi:SDR family oxidoreductase [Lentibacillus saliphilus]|uniref:SDR family oxidoreductase n=1 Tax=Lentibacillus saliphilus TaxID=2737028 RepID=UPI001C3026AC|nr:SDR family oxidoreductase [Lentibacillus saliphilus]
MTHTYFITGFPGFLARRLLNQLITDHKSMIDHIYLLVLPHLEKSATHDIHQFCKQNHLDEKMVTVVPGDITKQGLGIDTQLSDHLAQSVTHVFHLAAIYDLAVPESVAWEVNVKGTSHMNDWIQQLSKLKRYIYFSTAYVAGKREGRIYEHELDCGQSFKNHYEQTKYEAEKMVDLLKGVVPTTIIRPGIVKGDAETGQTIKFDGLYFMLNFLDSMRHLPIIPYLGDGEAEGNFVPADYVIKATSYLAIASVGEGKTYHLTDPNPYRMHDIYRMLCAFYLGRTPRGKIPLPLAKVGLSARFIRKWLKTEQEALDYFSFQASFDSSEAVKDLADSGVSCPDLKETLQPMIDFYRCYKDDYTKHIDMT